MSGRALVLGLLLVAAPSARAADEVPWGAPMIGPFGTPADLCNGIRKCGEGTQAQPACARPAVHGGLAPGPLFDELRLVAATCLYPDGKSGYGVPRVAVRTRAGWFATAPLPRTPREHPGCNDRIEVIERALRDVDGGGGDELVLRFRAITTCPGKVKSREVNESLVVLAAPDANGVPRATPPVLLRAEYRGPGAARNAQAEARFEGGALVVEPVTVESTPEMRAAVGRHPLQLR